MGEGRLTLRKILVRAAWRGKEKGVAQRLLDIAREWGLEIADAKTENTLISSARMKTGNPDIVKAQLAATKPPTVHPLVRTHPETGTKAVWFHKGKTESVTGMSPEETQDFLQDLTDRITQPQFCYAHEYKKGDLLIIDDRASLHKAAFDYDHSQHRRLYRMLVRGDRPR